MSGGSPFPVDEPPTPRRRVGSALVATADPVRLRDPGARHPGRWIATVALLITLVAVYVPFMPQMPSGGLDNSWMVAMNAAIAQRMSIGEDIAFTFGPFAGVYTRLYHPALDRKVLFAGLFLALQCFLCIRRLAVDRRPAALGACAVAFLFFAYSPDALLLCAALLAGLYAWRLAVAAPQARVRRGPTPLEIETAVVFAGLALLSLVKVTFVFLDAPMLVLSLGVLLWHRKRRLAMAAAIGFVVGIVGPWLVARQSLGALVAYLRASVDLTSGYTDAMSIAGPFKEVLLYWATVALLLVAIARGGASRASRLWLAAIVALVLLTASKAGFTRHDYHATIAAGVLLLTALLLRVTIATPLAAAALVVASGAAFYFDSVYVHSATTTTLARVTSTYQAIWNGTAERLHGSPALKRGYDDALEALRREQPYPTMPGTTDVYSNDQAHLLASNNRWNPRPVFQSYAAFNPALVELNRQHLAGPSAPDQAVVRLEPIDGHLPLSEDGPSWPELLARYRPLAIDGNALRLGRRDAAAAVTWGPTRVEQHAFGEPVALPPSSVIEFVRIDVAPTLVGRLVSFLFRIDSPRLSMRLADGTTREYRLITKSAASGFIASPLVDDVREAAALYSPRALAAKRVASLTVVAPAAANPFETLFWDGRFTVRTSSFAVAGTVDLTAVLPMDRIADESPAPDSGVADCTGSIDLVNGLREKAHLSADLLLKVDGWMDRGSAAVPDRDVFVTLTDGQGRRRYLATHATPRPDVAAYLKRPELSDAGYATTVDVSALQGPMTMGLAYRSAGRLVRCRQFEIPLTVER